MEKIEFTTRVLGTIAAYRLGKHQVTQTLRSESCIITAAIINGRVSAGEKLEIVLDNIPAGHAELLSMYPVHWDDLNIEDARQGGFDSLKDLKAALQRAGYRFKSMAEYHLFLIKFRWLESEPKEVSKPK